MNVEKPNASSCLSVVLEEINFSCASRAKDKNAVF